MMSNGKLPKLKEFAVRVTAECQLEFTVEAESAAEAIEKVWREEAGEPTLCDYDHGTLQDDTVETEERGEAT